VASDIGCNWGFTMRGPKKGLILYVAVRLRDRLFDLEGQARAKRRNRVSRSDGGI
jgi:hypothetical protein